ncbi:sugar phosphate isomerase/epimerase family protein [Myceligenerans indicum]|uniref:TIM barrel protein n=1 Tax=Myceligenerans indicum TaxID=2593663 RepID=A0ABS1LP83_9MICO|nr:sugar phosphate isomerase/epimerase [Myceligenerans indicum]MBL0888035.1 TIM barrel protein [Myceligenerans indicum]
MTLHADRVALNPIQWANLKADPSDPDSDDLWLFADPDFRADYPGVLAQVRSAGFRAVMMEVLDTQTLQSYERMVADAGLALAPGYASIALPEDHGVHLTPGSPDEVRWYDRIRRAAEESNYFGLDTIFLAPEMNWAPGTRRTLEHAAVGAGFDDSRLDRVIDVLGTAAEILAAEGVRAGLHNHVGTWVETEEEIERVLAAIPASLLGASFDIGHLAWAGIDPVRILKRHAGRLVDLHVKDLDLEVAAAGRNLPTPYRTAVDRGLFREPGLGHIDLDAALAALPDAWDGWVIIEVDRASMDPTASAEVSWAWADTRFS